MNAVPKAVEENKPVGIWITGFYRRPGARRIAGAS